MKARKPGTIENALHEICGAIGIDEAARVVGRSASHVRGWTDPDNDRQINLQQALQLDAAMLREHGRTPILEVYQRYMELIAREEERREADITQSTLELSAGVGAVAERINRALSPNSDGGADITKREAPDLRRELHRIIRTAETMDSVLESKTKL